MPHFLTRRLAGIALGLVVTGTSFAADVTGTVRARRDNRLIPLARATVIVRAADGSEVLASTKTKAKGDYAFRNLPAPRVALTVRRAGFYTHSAGGHDDRQIVLDCSTQQACLGVDFELRQGAVITGRVVDELGEPVQDVRVRAQASDNDEDTRERRGANSRSDDRGIFRLAGLQPGEYTLQTEHRRRRARAQDLPASSLVVMLAEGEELRGVELVLQEPTAEPVKSFSVSGRVTGVDLGQEGSRYLSARTFRAGGWNRWNTRVNEDGSFHLYLRAGRYRFRYAFRSYTGERGANGSVLMGSVEIDRDLTNLVLSPIPPTGVAGRLLIESGEPYDMMTLWLIDTEAGNSKRLRAEAPDYMFRLENLDPGEYRVLLAGRFGANNRFFVKEVRVGGEPSESKTVRLTAGVLEDVEIVLSADFSKIHGRVKAGLDRGELRKGAQYLVGLKGGTACAVSKLTNAAGSHSTKSRRATTRSARGKTWRGHGSTRMKLGRKPVRRCANSRWMQAAISRSI